MRISFPQRGYSRLRSRLCQALRGKRGIPNGEHPVAFPQQCVRNGSMFLRRGRNGLLCEAVHLFCLADSEEYWQTLWKHSQISSFPKAAALPWCSGLQYRHQSIEKQYPLPACRTNPSDGFAHTDTFEQHPSWHDANLRCLSACGSKPAARTEVLWRSFQENAATRYGFHPNRWEKSSIRSHTRWHYPFWVWFRTRALHTRYRARNHRSYLA